MSRHRVTHRTSQHLPRVTSFGCNAQITTCADNLTKSAQVKRFGRWVTTIVQATMCTHNLTTLAKIKPFGRWVTTPVGVTSMDARSQDLIQSRHLDVRSKHPLMSYPLDVRSQNGLKLCHLDDQNSCFGVSTARAHTHTHTHTHAHTHALSLSLSCLFHSLIHAYRYIMHSSVV